jgi:5'(3')-deoxyribonucleotidase
MPGPRLFVLGLDLDGVCADFYSKMREIAAEWSGRPIDDLPEEVTYGLPEWKLRKFGGDYTDLHKFAVTQRKLFETLQPIKGAAVAIRRLSAKNIRIRIITHRLFIKDFHSQAVQQTIAWLDKHDIRYSDLCFMEKKDAVGAHLYIEDAPRNIEILKEQKLKTIIFTNSTNRHIQGVRADDWKQAEKLVLKEFKRWKAAQKRATKKRSR